MTIRESTREYSPFSTPRFPQQQCQRVKNNDYRDGVNQMLKGIHVPSIRCVFETLEVNLIQ